MNFTITGGPHITNRSGAYDAAIYTEVRERLKNKCQPELALWATPLRQTTSFLAEARETMNVRAYDDTAECTEALEKLTEVSAGPGMAGCLPSNK